MKLQNRKTGEIVELLARPSFVKRDKENYLASEVICFDSLAELNEEWEDYEEPTGYWYIDFDGDVLGWAGEDDEETDRKRQAIGNYFETEEEAEKAVDKLKAWKRLEDNGAKFEGWKRDEEYCGDYTIKMTDQFACDDKDLDLLFGGEE